MGKDSGFTAYELAVTIAIISVITALTMPPYLRWWRESRLRSAVSNLTADLEMAKTRAIRENTFVVFELNAGSYTAFLDNNQDWNPNVNEKILINRDLPVGVSIDTASLDFDPHNDKFRFNGRGMPIEIVATETIKINQATHNRQISINRLGNINVQ